MFQKFIERPILSTVIAVITVILGIIGIVAIPVSQYPEIAPPTVNITTAFPGANAQTILESVIAPIEEQVNGVEGMKYIHSTASNDGSAMISVVFNQGIDPDLAAVNVQNRVSRANAVLPAEVTRNGVSTQKTQNSALMYASLASNSDLYDETYLQNYLKLNVLPVLQRVNGVSKIDVFGAKDYAMRIWLDPQKMANYQLTPNDVNRAIQEQSVEAAPGALGQNSGQAFEYVIKYKGRYKEVSDYENILIRSADDGTNLYLKDIAKVELAGFSFATASQSGAGNPSITFGVNQLPNTNARAINIELLEKIEELKKDFPEGIYFIMNYNTNDFLEASISKVIKTLIEAFVLVFIVVFIFLQDFRSTLIPAIAVPVSIVGAFFFLYLFGFSINLLTLFALILGIGIVVDDAIVVVEAVHAKIEKGAADAVEASKQAMSEISGAIISITLIMAAVFIPITFIQGPSGVFYKQFGITLVIAILISALNALTLSPALCAIFLKPSHETKANKGLMNRFFTAFNVAFDLAKVRYAKVLDSLIRFKWVTVLLLLISGAAIWWTNESIPQGFVPSEDRAVIFVNVELPPGASLGRTTAALKQLNEAISTIDNIEDFTYTAGTNFFSGAGSANALGFIILKDWSERTGWASDIGSITGQLFGVAEQIKDANILFFAPSSVPGYGTSDGFEFKLVDKKAGAVEELDQVAQAFVGQLFQRPEIMFASSSLNTNFPQYEIDLDVPKAKRYGVSVSEILSAMQGYFGGLYSADFNKYGKPYKVYIQAAPEFRKDEKDLASLFVRNNAGQMTPINAFVQLKRVNGAQTLSRFNLYNAVSFNGNATPGFSSGDAIRAIKQEASSLPKNYGIEFSGITKEEINSAGQAPIVLALSFLFVFFFLAAQYESFILPFAVLFSLPIGIAGAFLSTALAGLENNIYFQIALVMLIGLLAKNAILIVEFAKQRREEGLPIIQAAIEGAKERLRPILMTAFSFILGLVPLVFASGVGATGNRSIGTGAAGGLLIGTLIGVFVIPVLYVVFQWLHERISLNKVNNHVG